MCNSCALETAAHLLFHCTYARRVWHLLAMKLGIRVMVPGSDIQEIWDESFREMCRNGAIKEEIWTCWFVCALWEIRKQQNVVIFKDTKVPPWLIANKIVSEVKLWRQYCKFCLFCLLVFVDFCNFRQGF